MGRKKKPTLQGQKPQDDEGETKEPQENSECSRDANATPRRDAQNKDISKVVDDTPSNTPEPAEETQQLQLQTPPDQNSNNRKQMQPKQADNQEQPIENVTQQEHREITPHGPNDTPSKEKLTLPQQEIQLQGDHNPLHLQQQKQEQHEDQKKLQLQHQIQQGDQKMLPDQQLQQEPKLPSQKQQQQQQEKLLNDKKVMPQNQQLEQEQQTLLPEHEIRCINKDQAQQKQKQLVEEKQIKHKTDQAQQDICVGKNEYQLSERQGQIKHMEKKEPKQQKQTHVDLEIEVQRGNEGKLPEKHNIPAQQLQKGTQKIEGRDSSNKQMQKEVKMETPEEKKETQQQQSKLNQGIQNSQKDLINQQQKTQPKQIREKQNESLPQQEQTQGGRNINLEQLDSKQKQNQNRQIQELQVEHPEQQEATVDENIPAEQKEPERKQKKNTQKQSDKSSYKQQQNTKQEQHQLGKEMPFKQEKQARDSLDRPMEKKQSMQQQQVPQQKQGVNIKQNEPKQQKKPQQKPKLLLGEPKQQTDKDQIGEEHLHISKQEPCQASQNEIRVKEASREDHQPKQEIHEKLQKVEQHNQQEEIQLTKKQQSKQSQEHLPQNLNSFEQELSQPEGKKNHEEIITKEEGGNVCQLQEQQKNKLKKQQTTKTQVQLDKKQQQKSQFQDTEGQIKSQSDLQPEKQPEENKGHLKTKQDPPILHPLPEKKPSQQPQKKTVKQQKLTQEVVLPHQNEEHQSEHKDQEQTELLQEKSQAKSPQNQQKEQKQASKKKPQQKANREQLRPSQKTKENDNNIPENKQMPSPEEGQEVLINQNKLHEISEQLQLNPEELKPASMGNQKDIPKSQLKQSQQKQGRERQVGKKAQIQQTNEQVNLKQLPEHQDIINKQTDVTQEGQQQYQEKQPSQSKSKKKLKGKKGVQQTIHKTTNPEDTSCDKVDVHSEEQISSISPTEATHTKPQCSSLQELARKTLTDAGNAAATNAVNQLEGKAGGRKKRNNAKRNSATSDNANDSQSTAHGSSTIQTHISDNTAGKTLKSSKPTRKSDSKSAYPESAAGEGSKDTGFQESEPLLVDNVKKRRRRKKKNVDAPLSEQIPSTEKNVNASPTVNETNLSKSKSQKKLKHSKALDPNSPLSKALLLRAEEKLKNEIALANVSSSETSDRYFSEINKKLNILQRYKDEILSVEGTSKEKITNANTLIDDDGEGDIQYQLTQRIVFLHYACHVCKALTGENNGLLKRCSNCKMISYCSQEHQKSHWPQHKDICKVICKLCKNYGLTHLFEKAVGLDAETYRHFRIRWVTECTRELGRDLELWEKEMFFYPDVCHSCYQYDKAKLTTCDKCHHVSFCQPDHLNPNHETWCNDFKIYGDILRFQAQNGMIHPALPTPISNVFKQLPINMETHLSEIMKDVQALDPLTFAVLTDIATCPLTALFALQHFYPSLADLETLTIHLVGAEMYFEGDKMEKWESFLLHYLPRLLVLKIVLIGPELRTDFVPKKLISGVKCCDECSKRGCSIQVSFFPGELYHEYVLSDKRSMPDLICAMNAGLYRSTGFDGRDTWPPSIRAMLSKPYCPIVITAYTAHELPLDLKRVQELGEVKVIVPPMKNPYSSRKPSLNFVSEETTPLIFKNYYITLLQGLN